MNKVILMGRLTKDPIVRYSQGESQMAVARFTLAVDRRGRKAGDQGNTDFISCVAFGQTAEFFSKYIKQGTKICVEGRIQTGSYTNKDGQKVYTTDVVVENAEFAESKGAAAGSAPQMAQTAPQEPEFEQPRPAPSQAVSEGFMNIADNLEDEGLPFN